MPASTTDNRIILITGANQGIGYEATKLLSQTLPQSTLLLGTRSVDNGHKAIERMKQESKGSHQFDNVKVLELDVTKKDSIAKAAEHVKSSYGHLDVLMCNAGVSGASGESPETIFAVNIDGVHEMIEAFLPLIPSNGLIDVVASEVGAWATSEFPAELQKTILNDEITEWSFVEKLAKDWLKAKKGETHEQPWPPTNTMVTGAYCISKSLVMAYLRSFASQHKTPKLVITCPGYCATNLNKNSGPRPASLGGESVSWPVLHLEDAVHGKFYQDGKEHAYVSEVPERFKNH